MDFDGLYIYLGESSEKFHGLKCKNVENLCVIPNVSKPEAN